MQFQREGLPPNLTPSGQIAGEVMLQRGRYRVDKSVDVHRVDRLGPYGVAHDAQPDDLRRAQRRTQLDLVDAQLLQQRAENGNRQALLDEGNKITELRIHDCPIRGGGRITHLSRLQARRRYVADRRAGPVQADQPGASTADTIRATNSPSRTIPIVSPAATRSR